MIGRVDRLKQKEDIHSWKAKNIDLSAILYTPDKFKGKVVRFNPAKKHDHKLNEVIDETVLYEVDGNAVKTKYGSYDKESLDAIIDYCYRQYKEYPVLNTYRTLI